MHSHVRCQTQSSNLEREYFKHAAISSALVPFGITCSFCLKSPASIRGRPPMSASLFRMSRRDLSNASSAFLFAMVHSSHNTTLERERSRDRAVFF